MKKEIKQLPFDSGSLKGISQKTVEIHHGKLYAGYINKSNEIKDKLQAIMENGKAEGNQSYSELRALKNGEGFAITAFICTRDILPFWAGMARQRARLPTNWPKNTAQWKISKHIFRPAEWRRADGRF